MLAGMPGYAQSQEQHSPARPVADTNEKTAGASDQQRPKIIVFGDSLSAAYGIQEEQGWVYLLQQTLTQREFDWQIINASISGETTGGGLKRLPQLLTNVNASIVVLELGGNDALRGYPLSKIEENLRAMIALIKAAGSQVILVSMRIPPNYGPRYTRGFERIYREIGASTDVIYMPFLLDEVALTPGMMQPDGIHPTAKAQPLVLQSLMPYLEPLLGSN